MRRPPFRSGGRVRVGNGDGGKVVEIDGSQVAILSMPSEGMAAVKAGSTCNLTTSLRSTESLLTLVICPEPKASKPEL